MTRKMTPAIKRSFPRIVIENPLSIMIMRNVKGPTPLPICLAFQKTLQEALIKTKMHIFSNIFFQRGICKTSVGKNLPRFPKN